MVGIMVVGGYDAGNAVGAIEIIHFSAGRPTEFGSTASVTFSRLSLGTPPWWRISWSSPADRFPDLSSDPSVNCTQPGTNAFCYLEHLRLRFPSAADGDSF